ncbi:nuclear transport factor 2 family protein [Streptosporangium sp. NPDC051023]|uniref:nuclear transport factor 2 family protein n=1 Tax=Streptosporangium sp. NPDC051023 TaxID=3155410 RepID=UPI00344D238D
MARRSARVGRLGEVFADSVTLDYTSLNGGEPAVLTPVQIVEAWSGLLGAFDATQHLITNHLVTVDGDTAVCTASFQATHRLPDPFGSSLWTLGSTYRFGLVRSDGAWRLIRELSPLPRESAYPGSSTRPARRSR